MVAGLAPDRGTVTRAVIFGIVLAVTAYDTWALLTGRVTISRALLDLSRQDPIVAFLFGVLMGHLFWPQR